MAAWLISSRRRRPPLRQIAASRHCRHTAGIFAAAAACRCMLMPPRHDYLRGTQLRFLPRRGWLLWPLIEMLRATPLDAVSFSAIAR